MRTTIPISCCLWPKKDDRVRSSWWSKQKLSILCFTFLLLLIWKNELQISKRNYITQNVLSKIKFIFYTQLSTAFKGHVKSITMARTYLKLMFALMQYKLALEYEIRTRSLQTSRPLAFEKCANTFTTTQTLSLRYLHVSDENVSARKFYSRLKFIAMNDHQNIFHVSLIGD